MGKSRGRTFQAEETTQKYCKTEVSLAPVRVRRLESREGRGEAGGKDGRV